MNEPGKNPNGDSRYQQFSLDRELAAIAAEQRRIAKRRQAQAGVSEPVKTGFKRPEELSPELGEALRRLWKLGSEDQTLRRLYMLVARGHASLSEADFLELMRLPEDAIRKLSGWLVGGEGLKESIQKAFLRREVAPQVVSEEEQS